MPYPPNFMEQTPCLEVTISSASHQIPQHFMEPEHSLPYSQEPTTCLYPVPDESKPMLSHPISLDLF